MRDSNIIYQQFRIRVALPGSNKALGVPMSLSEAKDDVDEDLDKLWLYFLLTAWYNSKAGIVFDSFGSISGESNPNPSSMQALSSCRSSSERLLLRRWRLWLPATWLLFRLCHASSRSVSGDHDCCLYSGRRGGGACGGLDMVKWKLKRQCRLGCLGIGLEDAEENV